MARNLKIFTALGFISIKGIDKREQKNAFMENLLLGI
jgi:hypothetical protein